MSDIEILVREARELDAEIRDLTEKKAALVERIRAELKPGDFVVVDGVRASMREGNRKFDLATALKMLPEDLKLKCVVTCIDEKLVREAAEAVGVLAAAMIRPDDAKPVLDLAK